MARVFKSFRWGLIAGPGTRRYLLYALGEIVLVVAGILIALQVNTWNEARRSQARTRAILTSIRQEAAANLAAIEAALPGREEFVHKLQEVSDRTPEDQRDRRLAELPPDERMPGWRGAAPIRLSDAMFDAAKFSGVLAGLDSELLQSLMQTYSRQAVANQSGPGFVERVLDITPASRQRTALSLLWRIQEEFFGAQFLLTKDLRNLLTHIDARIDNR